MPPTSRIARAAPWLLGLLVLVLVVRALLPQVIARVAADRVSKALSARASVDDVDLWLLLGAIRIEGLAIAPAAGGPAWLTCDSAELDVNLWKLLRGSLDAEQIDLSGLRLDLVRERDGAVGWPGRVRTPAPPAEEPEPASSSEPLVLGVEGVSLRDVTVSLRDEIDQRRVSVQLSDTRLGPIQLRLGEPLAWSTAEITVQSTRGHVVNDDESSLDMGLTLSARKLSSAPNAPGLVDATLTVGDGSLTAKGSVGIVPLSFDLVFDWKDLALAPLVALAPPSDRPKVKSGRSHGHFELQLGAGSENANGSGGGLAGRGQIAIEALDAAMAAPVAASAAWKSLQLEVASLEVPPSGGPPPAVHLSSLSLEAPDVHVARPRPAAEEPAASGTKAPASGEGEAPGGPRIALDALRVTDGRIVVEDQTFDPPLDTAISGVSVDGRGLEWPERRADQLDVRIRSLGKKPLTLSARSDGRRGSGELVADRVSLLAVNPYVRQGSSYSIERGSVSIDSHFLFDPDGYRAPTRVVLHDLAITGRDEGGAFEKQFGMPLDMALVLLRDSSGDITLDLPIEQKRGSTQVALTRVVATTMRRVLVNALASPLKVAGLLIPGKEGGESFAGRSLDYEPGTAERVDTGGSRGQTDEVVGLLEKKPELGLRIEAVMVPADLTRLAEEGGFDPGTPKAPSPEARERLAALARDRLAESRARIVQALAALPDAEGRVAVVPWKGALGTGAPRVVAQLVLRGGP